MSMDDSLKSIIFIPVKRDHRYNMRSSIFDLFSWPRNVASYQQPNENRRFVPLNVKVTINNNNKTNDSAPPGCHGYLWP
jgi:hypothetical protein